MVRCLPSSCLSLDVSTLPWRDAHQGCVADVAVAAEREELVAKVRGPRPAAVPVGVVFPATEWPL